MRAKLGVQQALSELGGVATWAELTECCGARRVQRTVTDERITQRSRGRYVAVETSAHLAKSHAMTATLSHLSAALEHGWKVKTVPERAHLTVHRARHLRPEDRRTVAAHWRDLPWSAVERGVTRPLQTVLDCARDLPFDEALAVADSSLREQDVTLSELREEVESLRGPGSLRARRVARHACAKPANPFESVLRAIALDIPELVGVVPQLQIWDSDSGPPSTSPSRTSSWCSKPTAFALCPCLAVRPFARTAVGMTTWSPGGGASFASPGRRSCSSPSTSPGAWSHGSRVGEAARCCRLLPR